MSGGGAWAAAVLVAVVAAGLGGCNGAPPKAARSSSAAPAQGASASAVSRHADNSAPGPTYQVARLASGVRRIEIVDQRRYWSARGFRRLAPVIRVSLPSPSIDVAVYLRLPEQGAIGLSPPEEGLRRLQWPPGTEADRVTYVRHSKAAAGELTVADVRGSRIDAQGREQFHVYRPASGAFGAKLIGYEWQRSDGAQRAEAHALLLDHVERTPRAGRVRAPSSGYVRGFQRLMRCEGCHVPDKAPAASPYSRLPLWPTDSVGWYVPQSVMRDAAELSATPDFHDPNAGDPFVSARCRDGTAQLRQSGAFSWFRCPDGGMPMGLLDVGAGLAAQDAHSRAVCASRAWLLSRMTAQARDHFDALARECRL